MTKLYSVVFRPNEQSKNLGGGQGRGEVLVPLDRLTLARNMALSLPNRVSLIPDPYEKRDEEIERQVVAIYQGAVVVVPTVDLLSQKGLDTYREHGWPGLGLQAEKYETLLNASNYFGFRIPPKDLIEKDRDNLDLVGKIRTR